MLSYLARNAARRPSGALRRLWGNTDGVAAVEFGFIMPIMLLMLLGTVEISRAITIDRRFNLATSMIADLVTREDDMTSAKLEAIYEAVSFVMGSYDNGTFKASVIPVMANDDASETKVYATTTNRPPYNEGVDDPAQCDDYALTANLLDGGRSVIVVKSSYEFSPIILGYVVGNLSWTDSATASPRSSSGCVDFDPDGTGGCTVPNCLEN